MIVQIRDILAAIQQFLEANQLYISFPLYIAYFILLILKHVFHMDKKTHQKITRYCLVFLMIYFALVILLFGMVAMYGDVVKWRIWYA